MSTSHDSSANEITLQMCSIQRQWTPQPKGELTIVGTVRELRGFYDSRAGLHLTESELLVPNPNDASKLYREVNQVAQRPVDAKHPSGHTRAERIAATNATLLKAEGRE
jgi:hypothetical protein